MSRTVGARAATEHIDAEPTCGHSTRLVRAYVTAILERAKRPLPPRGFRVDWDDQPSKHLYYEDVPRLPLPAAQLPGAVPLGSVLEHLQRGGTPSTTTLGDLVNLLWCNGIIARRMEPNWNDDSTRKLYPEFATWARAYPSGGGMYPCELYLVSNSADGLPSGVYHYDTAHHSLAQLSREDRTRRLSESVGVDSSAFLVATIRFWKNAFKYNSFCYHVVGQDLGCLLATWRLVAAASRRTYRPVTVFDDRRVAHIIDVDPMTDGPFLVLPLSRSAPTGRRDASGGLLGQHAVRERSKRVRTFPLIEHVQAACIADPPMLPDDQCDVTSFPSNPAGERKVLPQPDLEAAVVASVIRRRSSFGLLTAATELPLRSLAATLELADKIVRSPIDDLDHGSAVRLRVLAGKVEGLERRSYLYEPGSGALVAGPEIDFHALQQLYPLSNYSIDQTSAIVTVSVNLNAYLDRYGPRGYRRASIDVGQACQGVCTAAAAERIGAGAVLGVDTTAVDGLAGVALPEQTLLCIMIGTERPVSADYMQSIRTPGTVTA